MCYVRTGTSLGRKNLKPCPQNRILVPLKAETHDATNRSNTLLRQVALSALLLRQVACPCFVTAICHTNSNQFEFMQQIAATNPVATTMIFTCHTRRFVAATDLLHRVSRPLAVYFQNSWGVSPSILFMNSPRFPPMNCEMVSFFSSWTVILLVVLNYDILK